MNIELLHKYPIDKLVYGFKDSQDLVTESQVLSALNSNLPIIKELITAINNTLKRFDISTPERICHFLSQVSHECIGFTRFSENLNYSAGRLLTVFPRYFKDLNHAKEYQHNPPRIGSRVYANRYGNGNEESQDGWKYRGRGAIQVTFKSGYEIIGSILDLNLIDNPNLLIEINNALLSAGAYWYQCRINQLVDNNPKDFISITKSVNGGTNGLNDRMNWYRRDRKSVV